MSAATAGTSDRDDAMASFNARARDGLINMIGIYYESVPHFSRSTEARRECCCFVLEEEGAEASPLAVMVDVRCECVRTIGESLIPIFFYPRKKTNIFHHKVFGIAPSLSCREPQVLLQIQL